MVRTTAVIVVLLSGLAILLAVPLWHGDVGLGDPTIEVTTRLSSQLVAITTSLQALATASLGLLAFLFSEKVSSFWEKATPNQRKAVLVGGIIILSSVITGLVTQWGIVSTIADAHVRARTQRVLLLQVIEGGELAAGFLVVSFVAVRALERP